LCCKVATPGCHWKRRFVSAPTKPRFVPNHCHASTNSSHNGIYHISANPWSKCIIVKLLPSYLPSTPAPFSSEPEVSRIRKHGTHYYLPALLSSSNSWNCCRHIYQCRFHKCRTRGFLFYPVHNSYTISWQPLSGSINL